jgi:hypothetical protein
VWTILIVLGLASLVTWVACIVTILIDAFNDAPWKGLLFFLCFLYGIYYAAFEFDHDQKWPIVLGATVGGAAARFFFYLAGWR